jgi:hypothetical protein
MVNMFIGHPLAYLLQNIFDKYFYHPSHFLAHLINLPKYFVRYLSDGWTHLKIFYHYNVYYLSSRQCFPKLIIFITSVT